LGDAHALIREDSVSEFEFVGKNVVGKAVKGRFVGESRAAVTSSDGPQLNSSSAGGVGCIVSSGEASERSVFNGKLASLGPSDTDGFDIVFFIRKVAENHLGVVAFLASLRVQLPSLSLNIRVGVSRLRGGRTEKIEFDITANGRSRARNGLDVSEREERINLVVNRHGVVEGFFAVTPGVGADGIDLVGSLLASGRSKNNLDKVVSAVEVSVLDDHVLGRVSGNDSVARGEENSLSGGAGVDSQLLGNNIAPAVSVDAAGKSPVVAVAIVGCYIIDADGSVGHNARRDVASLVSSHHNISSGAANLTVGNSNLEASGLGWNGDRVQVAIDITLE